MTDRIGFTWLLSLLGSLTALASTGFARSIYVDGAARGADRGTSWHDAYVHLQDALAAARGGDRVLVAQGLYRPDRGRRVQPGDRTASFPLKTGVTVTGGYAGSTSPNPDARNHTVYVTTLSGDLAGDDSSPATIWALGSDVSRGENSYHVVAGNGVTRAVLDGFHIVGGHANDAGGTPFGRGGGVYLSREAQGTLIDCTLTHNYALMGGAVCSFGATLLLENCALRENLAEVGGGFAVQMGPTAVVRCVFRGNGSTGGGGAIWSNASEGRYINCSLLANLARDSGGAIHAQASTLEVVNCLLCGNAAACSGGALNVGGCPHGSGAGGSHISIVNSTLAENRADQGNAVQSFSDPSSGLGPSTILVGNSILRSGGDEIRNNDESRVEVSFSNVQGSFGGEGNLDVRCFAIEGLWSVRRTSADPDSTVWTAGDYRLPADSVCVDGGYGRVIPQDLLDLDGDGDILEVAPLDVRGRPREAQRPGHVTAPDSLVRRPVDMGAYEYQDSRTVFRFWSPVLSRHFYTVSELEKARLLREYSDIWVHEEGAGFETFVDDSNPDTRPVYRFWSPQNDTHFYTIDQGEKDNLITEQSHAWVYEGPVFYAHPEGRQPSLSKPVYRFWSPVTRTHFYTISAPERDALIEEHAYAWVYEGIAWHAYELRAPMSD